MVLSFHPMISAGKNLLCAGRDPGESELGEIRRASAVILPQGCRESLFCMAKDNTTHVFPDYTARFCFPGKTGQARMFAEYGARTPRTLAFADLSGLPEDVCGFLRENAIEFPLMFKFDWGGESDTTHFVSGKGQLSRVLALAQDFEKTGQKGFVLQEFIPCESRSLRVVVMGSEITSYFRVAGKDSPHVCAVSKGAVVDRESDPEKQAAGRKAATVFCKNSGVDLAGIDLIFSEVGNDPDPYFLEVNYFFGRKGLGGSEAYYRMLIHAVDNWLSARGLARNAGDAEDFHGKNAAQG